MTRSPTLYRPPPNLPLSQSGLNSHAAELHSTLCGAKQAFDKVIAKPAPAVEGSIKVGKRLVTPDAATTWIPCCAVAIAHAFGLPVMISGCMTSCSACLSAAELLDL